MSKVFQSWTGFIKSWVLCHIFYGTYLLQTYCGWNAALSPQPTHNSTSVSSVSDYIDSILDSSIRCMPFLYNITSRRVHRGYPWCNSAICLSHRLLWKWYDHMILQKSIKFIDWLIDCLLMFKTAVLLNILTEAAVSFFRMHWWIESAKEQLLFQIELNISRRVKDMYILIICNSHKPWAKHKNKHVSKCNYWRTSAKHIINTEDILQSSSKW